MATPYEILQAENTQLRQRIVDKETQLQLAKQVHEQYQVEKQQSQDLLFACLHTLGPRIQIEIDHFHEFFKDAQFDGGIHMTEEGRYVVRLQFYQEGIEEHWRRKLSLNATRSQIENRETAFQNFIWEKATPEEAYTLSLNLYPNNL